MTVISLSRGDEFTVTHPLSGYAKKIVEPFDLQLEKIKQHAPYILPELPETWGIGVIVGASGTGKSTLLSKFSPLPVKWGRYNRSVLDEFEKLEVENPAERLNAAGLNSVPTWVRPMNLLSTGERFRAELALTLVNGGIMDEYTSVVSRPVAISASTAVRKWVARSEVQNLVFASCHYDVVKPLHPDWIINTDEGIFTDEVDWEPEKWAQTRLLSERAGTLGWK